MTKYIGVFDSGVGGLTAVKEIMNSLPHESIIYFGDTKNLPYGEHTKEELVKLVQDDLKLLNKFDVKAICVACNTSDTVINYDLEQESKAPVIKIIKPTCVEAIKKTKNRKIGVLATAAAIKSNVYEMTIRRMDLSINVTSVACPKFVPLIEGGLTNKEELEKAIHEYVDQLIAAGVDTIILGCTHYPLLEEEIKKITKDITLISSSKCLVNNLEQFLKSNNELSDNNEVNYKFYVSKDPQGFKEKAKKLIGKEIEVEEYSL